jgi:hypothetical protein
MRDIAITGDYKNARLRNVPAVVARWSMATQSADDRARIRRVVQLLPHFNVNVKCPAQINIKDHDVH